MTSFHTTFQFRFLFPFRSMARAVCSSCARHHRRVATLLLDSFTRSLIHSIGRSSLCEENLVLPVYNSSFRIHFALILLLLLRFSYRSQWLFVLHSTLLALRFYFLSISFVVNYIRASCCYCCCIIVDGDCCKRRSIPFDCLILKHCRHRTFQTR